MAKLSVHDAVTQDLASIWDFIDEKSGSCEIADHVIKTIQATFLELVNNPYLEPYSANAVIKNKDLGLC